MLQPAPPGSHASIVAVTAILLGLHEILEHVVGDFRAARLAFEREVNTADSAAARFGVGKLPEAVVRLWLLLWGAPSRRFALLLVKRRRWCDVSPDA